LNFGYLMAILAGLAAGLSGSLLRIAALVLGDWLDVAGRVCLACAAASFAWGYQWSFGAGIQAGGARGAGAGEWVAGVFLIGLGSWLMVRGLFARGLSSAWTWPGVGAVGRTPYNRIRRPISLGAVLAAAGLNLTAGASAPWIAWGAWTACALVILELTDVADRRRWPAALRYQRSVGRFLPFPPTHNRSAPTGG
jgi:hypothetical protein